MRKGRSSSLHSGIKQNYYCENPDKWWACAPSSIFYVLSSMGIKTTPETIILHARRMKSKSRIEKEGLHVTEIQEVFLYYGLRTSLIKFTSDERKDFYQLLFCKSSYYHPVLVFPPEHVISVFKVNKSSVFYIEPDEVRQITSCMSFSEFEKYCFGGRDFVEILLLSPDFVD